MQASLPEAVTRCNLPSFELALVALVGEILHVLATFARNQSFTYQYWPLVGTVKIEDESYDKNLLVVGNDSFFNSASTYVDFGGIFGTSVHQWYTNPSQNLLSQ
jgi:hypothetical protein